MCFQMTFAIITPALIAGAFAERMKFSAILWFMGAVVADRLLRRSPTGCGAAASWATGACSTSPAARWCTSTPASPAWSPALVLGKRIGFGIENMAPHNLVYSVIGASLLWVGWFGFNAGSAVAASGNAGMAMAVDPVRHRRRGAGLDVRRMDRSRGKPSVLGIISGAVAGLVAITPASGFVDPMGALVIGIVAGVVCYLGRHRPEEGARLRRLARRLRRARRRRLRRRHPDRRVRHRTRSAARARAA